VQRVVEAHGGRIAVASDAGKGTTVHVFLPRA
jgi:signal transduction histidine kinase